MQLFPHLLLLAIATGFTASCPADRPNSPLTVETSSGRLYGLVGESTPNVRQFLGVPFAHPPTGNLRWQPPSKLQSVLPINATNIGPACPQQRLSETQGLYVYSPSGGNQTEFFPPDDYSEDCLTLNVWAPTNSTNPLPVFVWYFGGGFVRGGTNSLYYNPQSWVQRTQQHIVVTVNSRSNIFGFPNADGLTEQNLGLMDQRLALDWVRANIGKFGGDASKIVAWGQSGGAIATDYLNFAYPEDAIMSAMILESGTAFFPTKSCQSSDVNHTDFSAVAAHFGCAIAQSPVHCLQNVTWQDIQGAMAKLNLTGSFLPVADERLVFSNYTERYELGAHSSVPAIIGSTQNELNALVAPVPGVSLNQTRLDEATNATFLCTVSAKAARFRETAGLTTYRYRYDGNFSNISPPTCPVAYHASELPLLFGTAGDFHGASTAYENTVSKSMQDTWLAFARDPVHGLAKAGWASYAAGKAVLIGGSDVPFKEIDISELDGTCGTM